EMKPWVTLPFDCRLDPSPSTSSISCSATSNTPVPPCSDVDKETLMPTQPSPMKLQTPSTTVESPGVGNPTALPVADFRVMNCLLRMGSLGPEGTVATAIVSVGDVLSAISADR